MMNTNRLNINILAFGGALVGWLSLAPPVHAEIAVEVEPVLHDDFGCGGFFDDLTTENPFERIPNVRTDDAINGIPGEIRNGEDGIAGGQFWTGNLPKMTDGLWSQSNDDDDNVWNMGFGSQVPVELSAPRLVQWDLGSVQPVTEINAYTRHCTTRSAQRHVVWGSDADVAPDVDLANGDDPLLEDFGWEFIALVDSEEAPEFLADPREPGFEFEESEFDGFMGSSVFDDAGGSLGEFRYILFHILDVGSQEEAYAEFDVVAGGPPTPTEDLNMDGFVDGLDLGILLGSWNTTTTPELGELNGTPPVDGLDLGILLGAWRPPGVTGAAAAVPEPGSLVLSSLAMLAWTIAGRRRRR